MAHFSDQFFYQAGSDRFFDSIVLADFSGDGIIDVGTQAESGIWLFTGRGGDGYLKTGILVPSMEIGYPANTLNAANIDGDGTIDLIAGTLTGFAVLIGNGDGTFKP